MSVLRKLTLTRAQRLSASQITTGSSIMSAYWPASSGAQRLSASQITTVTDLTGDAVIALLCSTPFGITDYNGFCPGRGPGFFLRGAQRLSASQITTATERAIIASLCLCSTPFGITDYNGQHSPVPSFRTSLRTCSTPFGITDYNGLPSLATWNATSSAQRLSASQITTGVETHGKTGLE